MPEYVTTKKKSDKKMPENSNISHNRLKVLKINVFFKFSYNS